MNALSEVVRGIARGIAALGERDLHLSNRTQLLERRRHVGRRRVMADRRRRLLSERDSEISGRPVATDCLDLVHAGVERVVAHGAGASRAVVTGIAADIGVVNKHALVRWWGGRVVGWWGGGAVG